MRRNFSGAHVRDAKAMMNWELMQARYYALNAQTGSYSQQIHLMRVLSGGVCVCSVFCMHDIFNIILKKLLVHTDCTSFFLLFKTNFYS